MTPKKRVLLTGAAGNVGTNLRRHWQDRYELILSDIRPVHDIAAHETFIHVDITDLEELAKACEGVDALVHLAADPSPAALFDKTLLPLNVIGAYNGFEAARIAGCGRIIFASSVNAILGHQDGPPVDWDVPVRPQNVYGATKCWGEALGRVYSEQHGLCCICVRLGAVAYEPDKPCDPDENNIGISPRDQAQFLGRCIEVQDLNFAIVHGVSRHRHCWMSLDSTCKVLDYEPQDGTAIRDNAG